MRTPWMFYAMAQKQLEKQTPDSCKNDELEEQ
jgi:hypothetical protein